jgi:hypothetical protein
VARLPGWIKRCLVWQREWQSSSKPKFSDAAIQFYPTIKCLFNLALRQAMEMMQSQLKLTGLDWSVLDFNTESGRQKLMSVTIKARPTTTGLRLLVDSPASRCWAKANGK